MKRIALLSAGLAVLMMATTAVAQPLVTTNNGLAVWYDVRPTAAEITTSPAVPFDRGQSLFKSVFGKGNFVENVAAGNLGGPGDGQVLRISPRLPRKDLVATFGAHVTGNAKKGFIDNSIKNLYTYITVEPNGPGTEQVIAALGRDIDVIKQGNAGLGNGIELIQLNLDPGPWSPAGTSASATPAGDDWNLTSKAVKVPVTGAPPIYNAAGGAIPTAVYRVACIEVTAGVWNKGSAKPADSAYAVTDKVNNLLMTRVVKTGGPAPAELPDFGYIRVNVGDVEPGRDRTQVNPCNLLPSDGRDDFVTGSNGGIPDAGTGDGSTIGTTSLGGLLSTPDATIIVQMKGDFDNNGTTNTSDIPGLSDAIKDESCGDIRQRGRWLGDFNNDNVVNTSDIPGFSDAVNASARNCTTTPLADCIPSGLGGPGCP